MYDEWENKKIHGIRATRYIASFLNEGGNIAWLEDWLRTLVIDGEKLTDDEILHIRGLAEGGKMELERNAKMFLTNFPSAHIVNTNIWRQLWKLKTQKLHRHF